MREAFPIVASLGRRLQRERTGWRDTKALIVLVAQSGSWAAAADLADALGVDASSQEAIFREVYGHSTHTVLTLGGQADGL